MTPPAPDLGPRVLRWERRSVALVTVAFGLWLAVWALVVPTFQAPDEIAHFDAAVHIAMGDSWSAPGEMHVLDAVETATQQQASSPRRDWSTMSELLEAAPGTSQTVNQMTQHPPTAYLVDAAVLRAVHFRDLRFDHAVLALRLADALAVTSLPLLAWASVRLLTRSRRAALVGALALFATPQLAAIGASVSNDAPVMLLTGLVVWLCVRLLIGDLRWRTTVGLGVALGAAIWVKGTALPAIPFVGLVVLVAGAGVLPLVQRIGRTAVALGVAAAAGAWWWLHNLVAHDRLQPDGYAKIRPPKAFPPGEHPTVWHFLDVSWGTLARTFWGSPGIRAQVSIGDVLTGVLTLLTLAAVVFFAFRSGPERRPVVVLAVFPALLISLQTATSGQAYVRTTEVVGTQGRYYFPAILCLIAISAVAWRRIPRSARGRRALAIGTAVAAPAVGLYGLAVVIAWFWGAARVPLTSEALDRYVARGPAPSAVVVTLVVVVVVGIAAGVVAVARLHEPDRSAEPGRDGSPDAPEVSDPERPRVLVLASTFPARPDDGVPAFVLDLAREEAREFDVLVVVPRVPGAVRSELLDGVRVERYPYFPRPWEDLADGAILDNLRERRGRLLQVPALLAAQYLAVRRAARTFRPDVVHAHWAIPQALVATLAVPQLPMLVTTHGGDVYALRAAPLVRLKRWTLRRAAHVTTVNHEMRARLTGWGIPEVRTSVVPMGVDLGPAAGAHARADQRPGRVVAVGRLVEKKGFGNLIEALREIEDVPWELVVIGDGPERNRLEHLAASLPVTFRGQRGKAEVLESLASASAVALPSVVASNGDQEGLPVTLLEAAAIGVAIVASDLPGSREVVEDEVSGLIVPPGDVPALRSALRWLLTDEGARERFGSAARTAAGSFSNERTGERYRTVLRGLIR